MKTVTVKIYEDTKKKADLIRGSTGELLVRLVDRLMDAELDIMYPEEVRTYMTERILNNDNNKRKADA